MRVLITGAAGFVGSHLADRFLADGHDVVGVDNLLTGQARNLAHLAHEPRFEFLEQDVVAGITVRGPIDAVLHLASCASPVDYYKYPIATLDVGSIGTRHALSLALTHDARFLMASTSEVYGDPHVHPQPERYWGNVNPVGPRSCYDESKRFAEALTMAFHRAHGLDTRIVRIFNTYGPRMRPNDGRVVSNFIMQALRGEPLTLYGDGAQTRSFCYVADEVEGLFRLVMRARSADSADPTNIGNPDEFTMRELAELVLELTAPMTGHRPPLDLRPLPADDPRQRRPDITRARKTLGWTPKVPLREGLRRTIAYFADCLAQDGTAHARTLDEAEAEPPRPRRPDAGAHDRAGDVSRDAAHGPHRADEDPTVVLGR